MAHMSNTIDNTSTTDPKTTIDGSYTTATPTPRS